MMPGYLLFPIILVILSISLFIFILIKGRPSYSQRIFLAFVACLGLWGALIYGMRASPDPNHAMEWERIILPLSFLLSVLFYHFSITYRTSYHNRGLFIVLLYILAATSIPLQLNGLLVTGIQIKSYGYAPILGAAAPYFLSFILVLPAFGLYNFLKIWRQSYNEEEKVRAQYIFWGGLSSLLGAVLDLLPLLGLPLYPGFIIGNLFFCVLTSIAIIKHKMLEVHVVLRRTVIYIFTLTILTLPLLFFLIIIPTTLSNAPAWIKLLAITPPVLGFPFFLSLIQRKIERAFHREKYDLFQALQAFSRDTQSLISTEILGKRLVSFLSRVLRTESAYLFLPSGNGDLHLMFGTDQFLPNSSLGRNSALIEWLSRQKNFMTYGELKLLPHFVGVEKEVLTSLGVAAVNPMLTNKGNLTGLILLGKRLSDQKFSSDDALFVSTLANQAAVRFENAHLYGEAVQTRKELENLSHRLVQIQEEERRSIARELHDEIGQTLIMTKMLVDQELKLNREKPGLQKTQTMLKEVISQVREISLNLRPSILDDLGLLPALQWLVERYSARTGIKVYFNHSLPEQGLSNNIITVAYRVIQEGLSNVAKHARAAEVYISLLYQERSLEIAIEDKGTGFDLNMVPWSSMGLRGMKERVVMLGGKIEIQSAPRTGTRIKVELQC